MDTPIISIFGAANRPELWMNLYNNLKSNETPFEIVFCGDVQPRFELPNNFHFIYSVVKPAQCNYIAFKNTLGKYIMPINDDFCFNDKAIDFIYQESFSELKNENDVLSMRYQCGDILSESSLNIFSHSGTKAAFEILPERIPRCAIAGLINREVFSKCGGFDNRFIATYVVEDITLRMWAKGGRIITSKYSTIKEICSSYLWNQYNDLQTLYSLWDKHDHIKRDDHIETYNDENLLLYSQGPKGKWK